MLNIIKKAIKSFLSALRGDYLTELSPTVTNLGNVTEPTSFSSNFERVDDRFLDQVSQNYPEVPIKAQLVVAFALKHGWEVGKIVPHRLKVIFLHKKDKTFGYYYNNRSIMYKEAGTPRHWKKNVTFEDMVNMLSFEGDLYSNKNRVKDVPYSQVIVDDIQTSPHLDASIKKVLIMAHEAGSVPTTIRRDVNGHITAMEMTAMAVPVEQEDA